MDNTIENMVRVGVVSDVSGTKARVIYPDKDDLVSGWLSVLQHSGAGVSAPAGGEPVHSHPGASVGTWMPSPGQSVLVLYIPAFDSDGFILGAI